MPAGDMGRRSAWPNSTSIAERDRTHAATTVFGAYDGGTYGALERVTDHLPAPPPAQPRQRLWKIVAKRTRARQPARSSGPWSSAATTGPA